MKTRKHNDPETPPPAFLEYMRENYVLVSDDLIFSLRSSKFIGTRSNGCSIHDGYKRIKVNISAGEKFFKYHHVVFFLYHGRWPRQQVDHIGGAKHDMRPENLQEVTDAENQRRRNDHLRNRRRNYYENARAQKDHAWQENENVWQPNYFKNEKAG